MSLNNSNLYEIKDEDGIVLAIVIKDKYDTNGINFITPDDYSQQLAYMHHEKGHIILPHVHNEVKRDIYFTKEVLIIKHGKIRCDLYNNARVYYKSLMLEDGDIILLVSGGHGFECLEETSMVEVKQGPYVGDGDKTRFEPYQGKLNMVEDDE